MPTQVRLYGDTVRADQYRFVALHQHLKSALTQKSFQNLSIYKHTSYVAGGVIDIVCNHDLNIISIYMPPEQAEAIEEKIPDKGLVIFLGDEFVGYHYFVWEPYQNRPLTNIKRASTLLEIYTEYNPAVDQDDIFIYSKQAALHPSEFIRYDSPYFDERMFGYIGYSTDHTDNFTRSYEHPLEGEVHCEAVFEQTFYPNSGNETVVFDGDYNFFGFKNYLNSLDISISYNYSWTRRLAYNTIDRSRDMHVGKLESQILIRNIPLFNEDIYNPDAGLVQEIKQHNFRFWDSIIVHGEFGDYNYIDVDDGATLWSTPIGYLSLKRRQSNNNVPCDKPWAFGWWSDAPVSEPENSQKKTYMWQTFREATPKSLDTLIFFPNIEEKLDNGFPWTFGDNTIGNKTVAHKYLKTSNIGFQIYSVSFVEWVGAIEPEDRSYFAEQYKADCLYLAAACGPVSSDNVNQKTNPDFEEAIAKLIDAALLDQREDGIITEHVSYKGLINGYFYDGIGGDIFTAPRSKEAERLKLLQLVNEERQKVGVQPVKMHYDLEKAAMRSVYDLANTLEYLPPDHVGSDGSTPMDRDLQCNYFLNTSVYTADMETNNDYPQGGGENAAAMPIEQHSAERAFELWKNSTSGHYENMIDTKWDNGAMGAAFKTGKYSGEDGDFSYWAQHFGYNPNY